MMPGLARHPLRVVALAIALIASTFVLSPAAKAVTCMSTAPGQLARWPGDNSTTEVAHSRDGTLFGDTTYATGEVNQAFSLDGNGDAVTVPDNPDWTLGGDFTVDVWVEFTAITGDVAFMSQDQGYGLQPKWLLWWYEGDINFLINTYAEGVNAVSVPWTPDVNVWHHLAVTRAGTSFVLYLDGQQIGTGSTDIPIMDAAAPLTFGSEENLWFWFAGNIDEPEIYQRALSPSEIKAIYDAGSNARCPIAQSTLTLTPPAWAYPNEQLTVNGSLSLSGGASAGGQTIDLTKSIDGGAPVSLGTATTASDGSFSFTDTPAAGTVVYGATFEGATDVAAENASATVVVQKKASVLSLSVSASKVEVGHGVTVTADLTGGFTNKTVTIWAVPSGGLKQKLTQGAVSSNGTLRTKTWPLGKTSYYATYTGDAHDTAATSPSKTVSVVPRWSVKILGGYATVKGFRLYHYSSKCVSTHYSGCPGARFTLSPSHAGQRVYFQGRYCHNGKCFTDSASWRLNSNSQSFTYVYYTEKSVIGWTLSFRMQFAGDSDHTASTSAWVKTRVTA